MIILDLGTFSDGGAEMLQRIQGAGIRSVVITEQPAPTLMGLVPDARVLQKPVQMADLVGAVQEALR